MPRHNVEGKTNEKENENRATVESQRTKLLRQIRDLEILMRQAESNLSLVRFGDIANTMNKAIADRDVFKEPTAKVCKPIDVERTIKNELCSLAGVSSVRIKNGSVFEFYCWETRPKKVIYSVQLLLELERWKLGKWVMPMSIDIDEIWLKYSDDRPTAVQCFLREIKHLIDCYGRRKQQYDELEKFFTDLKDYDCRAVADYDRYMRTTIKLCKQRCSSIKEPRYYNVYLDYMSDETTPSTITIEHENTAGTSLKLLEDEKKKLISFFKPFKKYDLKSAAEKIFLSSEGQSMWKCSPDNEIIDEDQDDESDSNMARYIKRKSKFPKNHGAKKRKVNESENLGINPSVESEDLNDLSKDETSKIDERPPEVEKKVKKKVKKQVLTRKNVKNSMKMLDDRENIENKSNRSIQPRVSEYFSPRNVETLKRRKKTVTFNRDVIETVSCSTPIASTSGVAKIVDDDISEIVKIDKTRKDIEANETKDLRSNVNSNDSVSHDSSENSPRLFKDLKVLKDHIVTRNVTKGEKKKQRKAK